MPDRSPTSWKPLTFAKPGSLLAGSVIPMGPLRVLIVTFAGTRMGSVSPAASGVDWPSVPRMMICVPGAAKPPATASARVTVLKLQFEFATLPMRPLPVALASLPLTGSTKYWLPETAEQPVHWLSTHAVPTPKAGLPVQSTSAQQLPGTHRLLQQKSPPLAGHAPLTLHVADTQRPVVGCAGAVLQIVLEP